MSGGTSAVQVMALATAAKGVVSGRAATDCHSRSAHRWRVSSARVRNSPASRHSTQSASDAATPWPSAPQHAALAMKTGLMGRRGARLCCGGCPWLCRFWERRASFHQAQGAGDQARQVRRAHGAVGGVPVGIGDPGPDRFLAAPGGPRGHQGGPEPHPMQGHWRAGGADRLVEQAP